MKKAQFAVLLLSFQTLGIFLPNSASAQKSNAGAPAPVNAAQVEKLLRTAPAAYSTHYTAGLYYENKGIVGEAQSEYRAAIACKNPGPDAFKHLAQLLLKSAEYPEAERIALAGKKLFPRDYGMLLTAGYVLHNEHKLGDALKAYEEAQKVQPNNAEIYVAMADVANSLNQPRLALQHIEKALSLSNNKNNELLNYEQAKTLVLLGRFSEALKPLNANFKINPLNFKNNKLYLSVLTNQKQVKQALIVQLCIMAPAGAKEMTNDKAALRDMLNAMPEKEAFAAIAEAESLIKEPKLKARLHFALGDVYDRIGQYQNGINQYKAGLALDPTLARGYLRLGEDLETFKKDNAGAMQNYKKAFELDPHDSEIILRTNQLKAKMK